MKDYMPDPPEQESLPVCPVCGEECERPLRQRDKLNFPESQINSERERIFIYGVGTSDAGFAAISMGVIPSSAAPSRF